MKKYEGHTPGPWAINNDGILYEIIGPSGQRILQPSLDTTMEDLQLAADAPMLAEQNDRALPIIKALNLIYEQSKCYAKGSELAVAVKRLISDMEIATRD